MRYHVSLAPAGPTAATPDERVVEVLERPDGSLEVRVDHEGVDVDVLSAGGDDGRLSVRVGARVLDVSVEGRPPDLVLAWRATRWDVSVRSERALGGVRPARAGARSENVAKSPMPGRVVKVLVTDGERVRAGQGLVVLEAMKMENEVRARAAGVVTRIHVAPGAVVEANAPLVTLG